MFSLAAVGTKRNVEEIAKELNQRRMHREGGKPWDQRSVYHTLKNKKYAGYNIYGMTTRALCARVKRIDQNLWTTNASAFAPLVTLKEFNCAQNFLRRRAKRRSKSDTYLLQAM